MDAKRCPLVRLDMSKEELWPIITDPTIYSLYVQPPQNVLDLEHVSNDEFKRLGEYDCKVINSFRNFVWDLVGVTRLQPRPIAPEIVIGGPLQGRLIMILNMFQEVQKIYPAEPEWRDPQDPKNCWVDEEEGQECWPKNLRETWAVGATIKSYEEFLEYMK